MPNPLRAELERLIEQQLIDDRSLHGTIEFDVPLSRCTYYRIGGVATAVATPKTLEDLLAVRDCAIRTKSPYFLLGWGSNLLCSDQGFPGLIIRMKQLFTEIEELSPGRLKVGASLGCSSLLRRAQEKGYGDLHHLTGIPGSVGGMIVMNAGTHLGEWKKNSISTTLLRAGEAKPVTIATGENLFSYRKNHFLHEGDIVLSAEISYTPIEPALVKSQIDELYQRRKQTQPVEYPSCGSVFMNPKESGLHAWQVLDQLNLRGHRSGDAQFSEKHPNFIVNLGKAQASDVKKLIRLAKTRAQTELGISLHEEVRSLGEFHEE